MLRNEVERDRLPLSRLRPSVLRLSVTDRCNFRCRYCMPAAGVPKLSHSDLLSFEDLARLAAWLAPRVGIERIKLTGGEPLVRAGIESLVRQLAAILGVREISLTTNGSRLAPLVNKLRAAGLARVNISLDSLDRVRFHELTRGGCLEDTLAGISAAVAVGMVPIKLNSVLQRSSWQQDVPLLLDYAAQNGFELRFIELMRTGTERAWCASEYASAGNVQLWLQEHWGSTPLKTWISGPGRYAVVPWRGSTVTVGWIMPVSHPFCGLCERLRLNARGFLYRCLMDPQYLDLRVVLNPRAECAISHRDATESDPDQLLTEYLAGKTPPDRMDNPNAMSMIGG